MTGERKNMNNNIKRITNCVFEMKNMFGCGEFNEWFQWTLYTDLNPIGFFQLILWNLCWTLEWPKHFWRDNIGSFWLFPVFEVPYKARGLPNQTTWSVRKNSIKSIENWNLKFLAFLYFEAKYGQKRPFWIELLEGFIKTFFFTFGPQDLVGFDSSLITVLQEPSTIATKVFRPPYWTPVDIIICIHFVTYSSSLERFNKRTQQKMELIQMSNDSNAVNLLIE